MNALEKAIGFATVDSSRGALIHRASLSSRNSERLPAIF